MADLTVRRTISMTPEMRDMLAQLAARRGRDVTETDLIRDAIEAYIDQQADIIGSSLHFQKSLQTRLDALEKTVLFHLHVLIALLSTPMVSPSEAIDEAIVAARRDGERLRMRIDAVRAIEPKP